MNTPQSPADAAKSWLRRHLLKGENLAPQESGEPGLILSGGGACASFQIGALQYLYQHQRINPQIITGTSAGSILGSVLAQYGDHAGQQRALDQLEALWRGMRTSEDMFAPRTWFDRVQTHAPIWLRAMEMHRRATSRAGLLQTMAQAFTKPAADPDDAAAPPARNDQGWSPATAFEALAAYWEAGRTGGDLQLIVQGVAEERSAFTPGPVVDRIVDPQLFDPLRLRQSPVALRIAVVALESGELRYVRGDGVLTDSADEPVLADGQEQQVDMVAAVTASCSIPGVFAPVPLAGEHYVDGGVRENVPFAIAEHLGVGPSYTVVATAPGVVARESFAEADMFSIVMRSVVEIMSDELTGDEVAHARRAGSVVIQPQIAVHDTVTIDPGLIAIAIDYGFMRAADVCLGKEEAGQELTRQIVRTRMEAWELENELFAPHDDDAPRPPAADASPDRVAALAKLGELKLALKGLIAQVPAEELPKGSADWWAGFEGHQYEIEREPHWEA